MKIAFFGTYNINYTRNSALRDGLRKAGADVIEVQEEIPNERMELPEDYTFSKTVGRIIRKMKAYGKLLSRIGELRGSHYIFVLHPGHLDVPLAKLCAIIFRSKIVLDDSISPYDTMFVGRNIADHRSLKAQAVKVVEKMLLMMSDKVFTDTQGMKQFLVDEFHISSNKIFVVPLGANDEIYTTAQASKPHKKVEILFFGLYNPLHGLPHIMEAIKLLKDQKNIHFTMLGDGYLKEELVQFVKTHQLKNVTFEGFVPEKQLVVKIQESDIMLGVFSDNFIFHRVIPNKVFAAIACAKPLISARYGPMQEFFTHKKNIYFCKPEDANDLAHAISEVANNPKLQQSLATQGHHLFTTQFSTQKIGETTLKQLESQE